MQGHVYMYVTQIECEKKTSIAVDCELENVGVVDKFQLLDAMCRALHVGKQEWMLYVLFRDKEM